MSEYRATISWQLAEDDDFVTSEYSRGHEWQFDGGVVVPASSSPHVVPIPNSVEANVDPEEAFVASLSSCHMLFFLSIAAKRRLIVERYVDDASGIMEPNEEQRLAMTRVTPSAQGKLRWRQTPQPGAARKNASSSPPAVFYRQFGFNRGSH